MQGISFELRNHSSRLWCAGQIRYGANYEANSARAWLADRETVLLTAPNGTRDRSVCIAQVDGQDDLRIHLEVDRKVPFHAGALSKALLACFPPDEVDEFIRRVGLFKILADTITDP
jgi:DNA-binding IclR family transcriptional regulator